MHIYFDFSNGSRKVYAAQWAARWARSRRAASARRTRNGSAASALRAQGESAARRRRPAGCGEEGQKATRKRKRANEVKKGGELPGPGNKRPKVADAACAGPPPAGAGGPAGDQPPALLDGDPSAEGWSIWSIFAQSDNYECYRITIKNQIEL